MNITFITSNKSKSDQVAKILNIDVIYKSLDLPEIQSLDLDEIVIQKAKDAYFIVKSTVLVEDVSLVYHVLGNLPGPLIKWFYQELGDKGLCRLINHYNKDRSATAKIAYCLYNGDEPHIFKYQVAGRIAAYPRGENGFGWDPIFIPNDSKLTWAEINDPNEGSFAMRKKALEKLLEYLI